MLRYTKKRFYTKCWGEKSLQHFFAQKMNIRAKYPVQLNRLRNNERMIYSYVHIRLYRKMS